MNGFVTNALLILKHFSVVCVMLADEMNGFCIRGMVDNNLLTMSKSLKIKTLRSVIFH